MYNIFIYLIFLIVFFENSCNVLQAVGHLPQCFLDIFSALLYLYFHRLPMLAKNKVVHSFGAFARRQLFVNTVLTTDHFVVFSVQVGVVLYKVCTVSAIVGYGFVFHFAPFVLICCNFVLVTEVET